MLILTPPPAQACYDAVAELGFGSSKVKNNTGSTPQLPAGCVFSKAADGTATAMFNTAKSATACKATAVKTSFAASAATGVSLNITLDSASKGATITIKGPSTVWFGTGISAKIMADQPYTLVVNATGIYMDPLPLQPLSVNL